MVSHLDSTQCRLTRLQLFPINLLAVVLGVAGLTLAFQKVLPVFVGESNFYFPFLILTCILFLFFTITYLVKIIRFPQEVKSELHHPVKVNFFPIFAKIFLITSIITLDVDILISKYLFFIGVVLQFIFSLYILSSWLNKDIEFEHLNPAWFIPIVGSVIVPIVGVAHGFVELSWFFFSIGLLMWLSLFIIVLNRIIFHHPLPQKLIPTLFILFAPPAIAFIAYTKLTDLFDPFAKLLYYVSLFMSFLIFAQVKKYFSLKFFISWWAYTFPTAALTVATVLMFHQSELLIFKYLTFIFIILLVLIVLFTTYKTVLAIKKREVCVQD